MRSISAIDILPLVLAACGGDDGLVILNANEGPEVTITAPSNNEIFVEGQQVTFEATITDDWTPFEELPAWIERVLRSRVL